MHCPVLLVLTMPETAFGKLGKERTEVGLHHKCFFAMHLKKQANAFFHLKKQMCSNQKIN